MTASTEDERTTTPPALRATSPDKGRQRGAVRIGECSFRAIDNRPYGCGETPPSAAKGGSSPDRGAAEGKAELKTGNAKSFPVLSSDEKTI